MKVTPIRLVLFILIIAGNHLFAQDKKLAGRIKALPLDDFPEWPTYIINKNYVVYEHNNIRRIIHPDIHSFKTLPPYYFGSGIALDKNGVYFRGNFIPVDTTGFKIVGEGSETTAWLWKTRTGVFKNAAKVSGIDAGSFEAVNCWNGKYFRDKNSLYYFEKKIKGSDPAGTSNLCDEYCYDKHNVYYNGEIMYDTNNQKILPVNDVLFKTQNAAFSRSGLSVNKIDTIKKMDAPSLTGLSRIYSMDKYHVYCIAATLPIAAADFENIKTWDQVNRAYISDGKNVYYGDQLETDFDVPTFGMLPHSDFCYDKNGIYEREWLREQNKVINKKLPFNYTANVNAENISTTRYYRYIIYMRQAYDLSDKKLYTDLTDAQISGLKSGKYLVSDKVLVNMIGGGYFTAENKVFYRDKEIKGIDAKSYVYIDYQHLKDNKHIYYRGYDDKTEILTGADPSTFKFFSNNFYTDKSYLYFHTYKLISSSQLELLAVYLGKRLGGDEGDGGPTTDYCLFRNKSGYWLIETFWKGPQTTFLGKTLNRKWNKAFEKL